MENPVCLRSSTDIQFSLPLEQKRLTSRQTILKWLKSPSSPLYCVNFRSNSLIFYSNYYCATFSTQLLISYFPRRIKRSGEPMWDAWTPGTAISALPTTQTSSNCFPVRQLVIQPSPLRGHVMHCTPSLSSSVRSVRPFFPCLRLTGEWKSLESPKLTWRLPTIRVSRRPDLRLKGQMSRSQTHDN